MKKLKLIAIMATLLPLSSLSSAETSNLDLSVYSKIGLPGFTLGAGYGINEYFTARADFATLGTLKRTFSNDDLSFQGKFSNNKLNLFVDVFPFTNGFRLTSGLGFLSTKLNATGYPAQAMTHEFEFGNKKYTVQVDHRDNVNLEVKFPAVSPYLGLGYGHHIKQQNGNEWGFLFDFGTYFGKPKTRLTVSTALNDKLVVAEQLSSGSSAQVAQQTLNQQIDTERMKLDKDVKKISVLPVISFGVSYRF